MKIIFSKCKVVTSLDKCITLEGKERENVGEFCFLGSIVPSTERNVSQRTALTSAAFVRLKNGIFSNRSISARLKARLYGALILPIAISMFLRCAACGLLGVTRRTYYIISRSQRTPLPLNLSQMSPDTEGMFAVWKEVISFGKHRNKTSTDRGREEDH